jgi:cyclopropane-fatty-acyl-phospholipid synthase
VLLTGLLRTIIKAGGITMIDARGRTHVIEGDLDAGPAVTIRLHDRALHRKLLLNPKLQFGEAYMEGTLTIEDGSLYDFIDVLCLNVDTFEKTRIGRVGEWLSLLTRRFDQHNPVRLARKNVAHHYDLSEKLYSLFLDEDRQYSCAYFTNNNESLEEAQQNKKRHIASKLLLEPGQRILDIGCGWGGLALYLARAADVEVVGLTLSEEQHKIAVQRAKDAGLDDKVTFKLLDYRLETEQFDRIVSVGMFEHVGGRHIKQYFSAIKRLLTDDGIALLHSIGRRNPPGTTNPWMRKFIFPGGYTPALSETLAAVEKQDLWVTDIEILRLHYADTLKEWNRRFQTNRDAVAEIYDERFCRMWEFYLQGSEISFRRLGQMVFQMQLSKQVDNVPTTRDYMRQWETANLAA